MKSFLQFILISLCISMTLLKEIPRVKVGVKYKVDNCNRRSKTGDIVHVHYKGSLVDGYVFDTSLPDGLPYRYVLGSNTVPGWDEGITRMCVGEKRRLIIPPELGYGATGSGHLIPPNAVLYFDVELMKLEQRDEL